MRTLLLTVALIFTPPLMADECSSENTLWDQYKTDFIQNDGRVIDHNDTGKSTSEGQAYGLFHALVSNDKQSFQSMLTWTIDNLAKGSLENHLPAWKWGKNAEDNWGVLEENSASDADVWLAYSLLEAGRLWSKPEYTTLGTSLLKRILAEEVLEMGKLGTMLLPGKTGFALSQCQWKLNPSYLPIQLFRAFSQIDPKGPWNNMAESTAKVIVGSSPKGIVPDWIVYDDEQGFISDPDHGRKGSYDAIRTYLWIGLLSDQEPLKKTLVEKLDFDCQGKCWPPVFSNTLTGERYGHGSPGFSAAVIPWLAAKENKQCLNNQSKRVRGSTTETPNYYDENLKLFALNWQNNKLKFSKSGHLKLAWETPCQ